MDVSPQSQTQNSVRAQLISEQAEVRQLASRDREVRAHEMAHASIGGAHASQPHYEFTNGPNGVRYATAGHVNIDVAPVSGDPAATVKKMQTVAKAALAPAQPSSADRAVAAKAKAQAAVARAELAQQRQEEIDAVSAQHEKQSSEVPSTSTGSHVPITGALIDVVI